MHNNTIKRLFRCVIFIAKSFTKCRGTGIQTVLSKEKLKLKKYKKLQHNSIVLNGKLFD